MVHYIAIILDTPVTGEPQCFKELAVLSSSGDWF